jgi:hypothetical protein
VEYFQLEMRDGRKVEEFLLGIPVLKEYRYLGVLI